MFVSSMPPEAIGWTAASPVECTFCLADYVHDAFGIFYSDRCASVRVCFDDCAATNVRKQQWHPSQKLIEDRGKIIVAGFELSSTV